MDNVCGHISVYKVLGSKETLELEEASSFASFLWNFLRILLLKEPYLLIESSGLRGANTNKHWLKEVVTID